MSTDMLVLARRAPEQLRLVQDTFHCVPEWYTGLVERKKAGEPIFLIEESHLHDELPGEDYEGDTRDIRQVGPKSYLIPVPRSDINAEIPKPRDMEFLVLKTINDMMSKVRYTPETPNADEKRGWLQQDLILKLAVANYLVQLSPDSLFLTYSWTSSSYTMTRLLQTARGALSNLVAAGKVIQSFKNKRSPLITGDTREMQERYTSLSWFKACSAAVALKEEAQRKLEARKEGFQGAWKQFADALGMQNQLHFENRYLGSGKYLPAIKLDMGFAELLLEKLGVPVQGPPLTPEEQLKLECDGYYD